ncbi:Mycocerosate synthase [Segniliparus rotundus DSM 44985]|uniref:Mycocerosate synthase n=1 Tax=Segniliparus rotundus (strain ATCC BAA-972 / CDC 1076 / CIP 108378 / DSM 44985 / JCM 13578) TaxID=640132 RepID=D6ZB46_SEGRD|nr:type I polyketide synthase [Segniliparus rotundus]ADG96805.1 Mycocerosate synthase [Segniliparus rotundus DSM 44985]
MVAVAIVGIGCKFPGGIADADSFWDFILNKGDAVTDIPGDRWDVDKYYDPDPDAPGRMYVRRGGFLTHQFQQFDADFFGISRREAAILDPQQRLLLETVWEALDDAGLAGKVSGEEVGTFIGGFTNDNAVGRTSAHQLERINNFAATSSSQTLLANRLAYALDLRGPSMTVDTACSSSLVATHLAVRAIESGECDVAIAGGSNVMFQPETFITMCKGRFLAADGRCKSFDAAADGYGRGEGVGAVVLKGLEQALRDGDRVYAVIRASGVNQDGRTPSLPVPNPVSQQRLAERVLKEAGIDPALVGYVEAHGTGTNVGDPLELTALGNAYGRVPGRDDPLLIGSVKNNFGHTEAAAGVAGLIKAALTVQRRIVAPQVWLEKLNPQIPFEELRLRVPMAAEKYPDLRAPAFVAVNSFGYGGTNAHVLVEEPPAPRATGAVDGVRVFPLSARSEASLRGIARSYAQLLESDRSDEKAQRLKTAATGRRAHHFLRKGIVYRDADHLFEQLNAYADNDNVAPGRVLVEGISEPVFVFSGMGPQWWAMGRGLLERPGVFRDTAEEVDAAFRAVSGWSVLEELLRPEGDSTISRTDVAQPANFLVQAALAKHVEQFGAKPVCVVGHSVGEVASAYVSGALSLHDAATVAFHRSRLQAKTAGTGGMLAVGLGSDDARRRAERFADKVCVAAINSSAATTLAGDFDALREIHAELVEEGIFARTLRVEVPYHSHLMEPILDELATALRGLVPRPAAIPVYSTVTGAQIDGEAFADPAYWQKNVREPVLFAQAIDTLIEERHRAFLEIGPHPVLAGNIRESFVRHSVSGAAIPTLDRNVEAEQAVLQAVADLYAAGSIDVPGDAGLYSSSAVDHVDLPTYPWAREQLWEEEPVTLRARYGDPDSFPLLGDRTGDTVSQWGLTLAPANLPWLPDHVVAGSVVLPGTAYLDAALSAARQRTGRAHAGLDSVAFVAPLVIAEHDVPITRLSVEDATKRFVFKGRSAHTQQWTTHAYGRLVEADPGSLTIDIPAPTQSDVAFAREAVYEGLSSVGLSYGPAFQRIRSARIASDTCVAQLESPSLSGSGPARQHTVHPTLSDAALQCVAVLLAARPELVAVPSAYVPASVDRVRFYHEVPENPLAVVEITSSQPLRANAYLASEDGDVALAMFGVTLRPVGAAPSPLEELDRYFFEPRWEPADEEEHAPAAAPRAANAVVLIGNVAQSVEGGCRRAAGAGARVVRLASAAAERSAELAETLAAAMRDDAFVRVLVAVGDDGAPEENVHHIVAVARALTEVLASDDTDQTVKADAQAVVVSRGAFFAPGDHDLNLAHAGLAGARRTIANEQLAVRWSLLDTAVSATEDEVAEALGAAGATAALDEVAVRAGRRWVQRMRRSLPELTEAWETPFQAADPEVAYEVQLPKSRLLKDIALRECDRVEPGPRQVEIRVETIGLNYKDPLKVIGILADRELEGTYFGLEPGMEGFGVVTRVGSDVREVRVGDGLIVSERGLLRRYLTFDLDGGAAWAPLRHEDFSDSEFDPLAIGSGLPFLTAAYAFRSLVGLQPGERVLVHGAAGGMGMGAVQLAVSMGAVVYATAGTEERRRAALELGAAEVFDSRSVGFVDDVLRATQGRGVDVVYNSLPGEVIAQNFAVAGEFCRIVEIGKADIYFGGSMELKPFNRNLTFHSLDMDRLMRQRPDLFRQLLQEGVGLLTDTRLRLLPYTRFSISDVAEAFEAVFRARHVGRIVVDLRDEAPMLLPRKAAPVAVRPDGSYLITGGFGAFGLATARSLAREGATRLILVGRSGAVTSEVQAQVESLRASGVEVLEKRIDIADYDQVAALVSDVESSGSPLRGVFHTAGVIFDEPIGKLTLDAARKVFAPKVVGALNLDRALREHGARIDSFVLYSSISALVGAAPQTSYAAANSALDAFAQWRRAQGLPALSVNWGALSGGMAVTSDAVQSYLDFIGFRMVNMETAAALLHECSRFDLPHVAVMGIDWGRWRNAMPAAAQSTRFSHLAAEAETVTNEQAAFRAAVLAAPEEERGPIVTKALAEQLAEVLGVKAENLDPRGPLVDLGIDSLMAVEFGARAGKHLNIQVAAFQFTPDLTLEAVGARIAALIVQEAAAESDQTSEKR